MSYASVNDMVIRFGEAELWRLAMTPAGELDQAAITIALQDAGALIDGELDQAVITIALQDAGSLFDGYLAGRYPLPLAHIPSALVPICADIATTASMANRRRSRSPSATRPPLPSSSRWARGSWRLV
ncbi:DUF1320 domain-containing protein [Aeromonas bestiarum]|uniref:DUF1320 domain-containing protein n=1 Tax=Aeromonas bestiarum TaxID=105751 RepID=A0ABT7PUR3_9GAMM|nr:DUF1320 domain-containing protein [Aeromonas bestiarum]MDM5070820.1 DUF1320 domain-containing protein [Aeromonas bestiarum]